jgi:tetratricopeptide (TPR) repeat protein
LRRTPEGWKRWEAQGWPVKQKDGDRITVYDAETWKERDAHVEKARKRGDLRELVKALDDARRYAEAYTIARKRTERPEPSAADWVLRGNMAFEAGEAEDAVAAYRKVLALDPAIGVPPYMSRTLRTLRGHTGFVFGVAFNLDGEPVGSGSSDGTVRI